MKKGNTRKKLVRRTAAVFFVILITTGAVFSYFGGFGTGKSADPAEYARYAESVSEIVLPEDTRIIALGEASHGNREFQQLKLDVFQLMAEKYGVRAFALEGDYGGCEAVNRYIHGGDGTAEGAAAAIGFAIYRTKEIANLIEWMRNYNMTTEEGDDIRFYGFDMQRIDYNYRYLLENTAASGLDTSELEKLWAGEGWSETFSKDDRAAIFTSLRQQLTEKQAGSKTDYAVETALHLTDILLQNNMLETAYAGNGTNYPGIRDGYMAENTLWILSQEEARQNHRIFITGHNGHMEQFGTYVGGEQKVMGNILADKIGRDAYFVIGTDFFKTSCNLPTSSGKRVARTFYSRDPLAKAALKSGLDISWIDFSKIPSDSSLSGQVNGYIFMGSLGDNKTGGLNGLLFRLLPYAYRVWQQPSELYDGMIFVARAHPTQITK